MSYVNVLVVSHGAALGGSPISALNIGRHIDKTRFQVIYAFAEDGPAVEKARAEGFVTTVIPKYGPGRLGTIWSYIKYIRKYHIDVVHLNSLTSYYKYPAYAAKLLKKPMAWFVRENPSEKRCTRLAGVVNRLADKVVTVSYDTANHMAYVKKGLLHTIHNGVDLTEFKAIDRLIACESLGLVPNRKYVTVIAAIEPRKGVFDLVQAFEKVYQQTPDYDLLIVGKDRTHDQRHIGEIKKYLEGRASLQNRVLLYGEGTKIVELLSASNVFVMPSYWEGLSRAILEAMACGLPLLVSSNGGNKEQVVDGDNGYSFEAGDIEAMASKLALLLNDGQLEAMGQCSRAMAEQQFDIHVTSTKLEQLYSNLQSGS